MPIALKNLLAISPMREDVKQELLTLLDSLSEDERFRLSRSCWAALALQFQVDFKAEIERLLLEIREGKRKYSANDFTDIELKLYRQLAEKLGSAESEGEIKQVKEELEKYLKPMQGKEDSTQLPR